MNLLLSNCNKYFIFIFSIKESTMLQLRSILLYFLFSLSITTSAQFYSSGADPANIKWRQVNSDNFKVVYPDEFEEEAKRFIAMLDSLYAYGGYTLEHTPKPINVLIHSRSAYSNGFVSWAPKRMEIYPTPHQDMVAQDWLEQLAIHEFRHVVQIDKLNKGFTKILTIPFGQQAIGAALGLYVPLWFLEGDATLTETTLSNSGRGRCPSFEQEIRAQILEKQIYNYDKAYFGSYKDYVPNHYHMGYLLTAGARHKYGSDVWERSLDETGKKSWSITPFNRGIKQVTGKNKVPLYNEVFSDWQERWEKQNNNLNFSPLKYITQRDVSFKNYHYPIQLDSVYIIAETSGPGELNHFAKININSGKETKLLVTGSRNREPFSYNNNTIVWTELEQHPRWDNQLFSIIRTLDLSTGKQKKITTKSRYKAPCLSPNGKTIAVTNTSYSNVFSIHLLSTQDGSLIKEIKTPDNAYPMTPSWNTKGDELALILLTKNGKKIVTLNPSKEAWQDVLHADFTEIRFPKYIDEHIYFSGSWSGIENIYRIKRNGKGLEKVSESKFGAAYATKGLDNTIYYQNYTSDGYLVASSKIAKLNIVPFKAQQLPNEPYINKLQADEKGLVKLKNISTKDYTSKKYSKWNLFNFHSWAPAFVNIDDASITTGASLLSQNLLGTTFTSIGFNADKQYSREKYYFKLSYQAWWPIFELEVKLGDEKVNGYQFNDDEYYFNYFDSKPNHCLVDFEMKLPLNFTRGKYSRRIQPSIRVSYQQSSDFDYQRLFLELDDNGKPITDDEGRYVVDYKENHTARGLDFKSLDYSLFAYNILRSTQRDVASRFGQVVELNYRHTPINGWDYGSIFGVHTRLYFPAIGRHHAIRIDNDWHTKNHGEYYVTSGNYNYYRTLPDYAKFPRGINQVSNNELYSFKSDYMMPLIDPDLNIKGVMYLKRITTNLFFDYTRASQQLQNTTTGIWTKKTKNYKSLGTELRAELHPFRFVFPISIGYRYAYIPDTKSNYHEVLFSMGLASIVVGK